MACTNAVCSGGVCVFGGHAGQITVDLEVEGVANPVTRNATFIITTCGGNVDTRVVPLTMDGFGQDTLTLSNVDVNAEWLAVREGHTLRKLVPLTFTNCEATVDLTITSELIAGDFQTPIIPQDNLVDITDFSILAARLNQPVDPTSEMEGDVSADGMHGTDDFATIQPNFFAVGDPVDGCPAPVSRDWTIDRLDPGAVRPWQIPQPRWRVSVEELGFDGAWRADLTGDGFVDLADVEAFARMYGLRLDARLQELIERERSVRTEKAYGRFRR
ncbi:MAG: hypothetical protein D6788_10360 [Planctomycetota bacterium]|nr:MAG: hypothetical protein D6788_10360 [Planctomycetota bacterium]